LQQSGATGCPFAHGRFDLTTPLMVRVEPAVWAVAVIVVVLVVFGTLTE
jgi:hypothetical protein